MNRLNRSLSVGLALGALASVFGLTSCVNILGIEDTEVLSCEPGDYAYDGSGGEGEGERKLGRGEDFSCVGQLGSQNAESDTVTIQLLVVNLLVPSEFLEGITIKACGSRGDVNCNSLGISATTDATGIVELQVPTVSNRGRTGYEGYLEIQGTDAKGREFLPYLQFFTRPITRDRVFPISLVEKGSFGTLFPVDKDIANSTELGALALDTVDCENAAVDNPAESIGSPNIRYSIQNSCDHLTGDSREFYMVQGIPSTQARQTVAGNSALGGFIGVKPGNDVVVQAFWRPNEQNLKVVEDRVIVRPGTLTTLRFEPNQ